MQRRNGIFVDRNGKIRFSVWQRESAKEDAGCNINLTVKGNAGAEFAMPKRTKQMGGIEQRLRIFVEDYVYTYLYQYGRSGGGAEKLAALVGKYYELEGQRVLLISGAIQAKGTVQEGGTERFGDETWEIHRRAAAAIL